MRFRIVGGRVARDRGDFSLLAGAITSSLLLYALLRVSRFSALEFAA